ncbi:NADPH-dependent FMN reductase [Scleromatobacter humisilvae]|uniref:NAD(P)H-dependent oxidoreductase n=1 Tax=Scleromatobacter humisilvae TaxID=2897159 RepID=A0A9X1YI13_9BURK|nr:NADPH-dependent FMN reductase [Scleromatobacter humisilvae]MCK9685255.1 NAD(P)H-dependent oxidoreductase [Scleromatobacter humisilvae]
MQSSDNRPLNVLALCGSLRAASINAALLRAAARIAAPGADIEVADWLGRLPLFNPDLENVVDDRELPRAVKALHLAVDAADAILIASPEYAHGISGTIKNTLDWLVSFEPFIHKPVAVVNVSPRAHHADDALRETLRTMSAGLVGEASFAVELLGAHMDEDAMAASPAVADVVAQAIAALRAEIGRRASGDIPVFPLR